MIDEYFFSYNKNEILVNFWDDYVLRCELDDENNIKGHDYGYAYYKCKIKIKHTKEYLKKFFILLIALIKILSYNDSYK